MYASKGTCAIRRSMSAQHTASTCSGNLPLHYFSHVCLATFKAAGSMDCLPADTTKTVAGRDLLPCLGCRMPDQSCSSIFAADKTVRQCALSLLFSVVHAVAIAEGSSRCIHVQHLRTARSQARQQGSFSKAALASNRQSVMVTQQLLSVRLCSSIMTLHRLSRAQLLSLCKECDAGSDGLL